MRVTLGQVRELLREAQDAPDAEFRDLVQEVVGNLKDLYGEEAVWREMWRIEGGQHIFWVKVTTGALKDVDELTDAILETMKMITGDPSPYRDVNNGMGAVEAGDFRADLFIDPLDKDQLDIEVTLQRRSEMQEEHVVTRSKALHEASKPDAELSELVDEMLQNLKDTFTPLEVMDANWRFLKVSNLHEFNVLVGDEVPGHGNTQLLGNVVDAIKSTMTMMTGDPHVNVKADGSGAYSISAGDFVAGAYEDWDYESGDEAETEYHWVFVFLRRN